MCGVCVCGEREGIPPTGGESSNCLSRILVQGQEMKAGKEMAGDANLLYKAPRCSRELKSPYRGRGPSQSPQALTSDRKT